MHPMVSKSATRGVADVQSFYGLTAVYSVQTPTCQDLASDFGGGKNCKWKGSPPIFTKFGSHASSSWPLKLEVLFLFHLIRYLSGHYSVDV